MIRLKQRFSLSHLGSYKHNKLIVLLLATGLKLLVSLLTPLSLDFIRLLYASTVILEKGGVAMVSPAEGGFCIFVLYALYKLWLFLSSEHLSLEQVIGAPEVSKQNYYFVPSYDSYLLILLMKLPIILFDCLAGLILYSFVKLLKKDDEKAMLVLCLWLFNPYALLLAEMKGTLDVIAAFFLLLSLYFYTKNKESVSAIFLALGGGIKLWPLLAFPIFLIDMIRRKGKLKALAFAVLLITSFFFSISYRAFTPERRTLGDVFMTHLVDYEYFGLIFKKFHAQFNTTVFLLTIFLFLLYTSPKMHEKGKGLVDLILSEFLLIFVFSYWNSHYLLWVLPFLTLDFVLNPQRRKIIILLLATVLPMLLIVYGRCLFTYGHAFFYYPSDNNRILSKLSTALWNLPENPIVKEARLVMILYSVFSALCLIYSFSILYRFVIKDNENEHLV